MQRYTLGFVFCDEFVNGPHVLLTKKKRPEWQKGLLNGIGGHVEETDHGWIVGMAREGLEEVGHAFSWQQFAFMTGPSTNDRPAFRMAIFRAWVGFSTAFDLSSKTDEPLVWVPLREIPITRSYRMIPNLSFLIPMAYYTQESYKMIHLDLEGDGTNEKT